MVLNSRAPILCLIILFIPLIGCGGGQNIKDGKPVNQVTDKNPTPEGIWEDSQTGSKHTVIKNGNGYKVESIITNTYNSTPETMDIRDSKYENGRLSWSYFVPSTGYTVHFESVSVEENIMQVLWTNNDGKGNILNGQETLIRIVNGKRAVEPKVDDEEYTNYNDTPDEEFRNNPEDDNQRGDIENQSPEDELNNRGE